MNYLSQGTKWRWNNPKNEDALNSIFNKKFLKHPQSIVSLGKRDEEIFNTADITIRSDNKGKRSNSMSSPQMRKISFGYEKKETEVSVRKDKEIKGILRNSPDRSRRSPERRSESNSPNFRENIQLSSKNLKQDTSVNKIKYSRDSFDDTLTRELEKHGSIKSKHDEDNLYKLNIRNNSAWNRDAESRIVYQPKPPVADKSPLPKNSKLKKFLIKNI